MLVCAQPVLFSFHGALNVKSGTLECFTLYLRNRQSGNLRAIENCVCSIRSLERNMTSIFTDGVGCRDGCSCMAVGALQI
jgi:hypothetical protein